MAEEVAVESAGAPALRRAANQATGILPVQLNTTPTITYALLQAYALALDSRILIEQAKGVIATTSNTTMDRAFAVLRSYAGDRNLPLRKVAGDVISRRLHLGGREAT